jgi:RNA polymerase sigma factor (sigma-70 family)
VVSFSVVGSSVTPRDAQLFEAAYPALRRFAGAVRPPGVDADDLVQEALARTLAVRTLESLDDPGAYLRTAIVRVAANLARGRRRALDRSIRIGPPAVESADEHASDLADLMRVSPRARAVLFLVHIEGRPYKDAASLLGCSEDAARAIASRALRQLRRELLTELEVGEKQ